MRVLLAVSETCDPLATSDYLAARFDGAAIEVDVLSVVPHQTNPPGPSGRGAGGGAPRSTANGLVTDIVKRLDQHHGFRRVRAHVRYGAAADTIVAASERWRSTSVLIGAPRQRGLLTAFGIDSVARAVSARTHCPVELLRPSSIDAKGGNRVLAVLDVAQLDEFPFDQLQLQTSSWSAGSLLRILGVLPPAIKNSRVDGNPAAILRAMNESAEGRSWAAARLDTVCHTLAETFGPRVTLDYRLVEGSTRDVALENAERLGASLLVLGSAATDGALRGLFSSLSPAAITMAAPCSVLLLRSGVPSREPAEVAQGSGLAPFPRS